LQSESLASENFADAERGGEEQFERALFAVLGYLTSRFGRDPDLEQQVQDHASDNVGGDVEPFRDAVWPIPGQPQASKAKTAQTETGFNRARAESQKKGLM